MAYARQDAAHVSHIIKSREEFQMFVKQISVFLENNPGTLRELTELLGEENVVVK